MQDIETAETVSRKRDHPFDFGRLTTVGTTKLCRPLRCANVGNNPVSTFLIDIDDYNGPPSRAKVFAVASPIPEPAPVMSATLSLSRMPVSLFLNRRIRQTAPDIPRSVEATDLWVAQQLHQHEPGMGRAHTNRAVGNRFFVGSDALMREESGQFVSRLKRVVCV